MAPGILHDPTLNYTYPIKTSKKVDRLPSQVKEWPTSLATGLLWDGEAYAQSERYTYHLTDDDKSEIDRALDHFGGNLIKLSCLANSNRLIRSWIGWESNRSRKLSSCRFR